MPDEASTTSEKEMDRSFVDEDDCVELNTSERASVSGCSSTGREES
jgi:hypothetical protein